MYCSKKQSCREFPPFSKTLKRPFVRKTERLAPYKKARGLDEVGNPV